MFCKVEQRWVVLFLSMILLAGCGNESKAAPIMAAPTMAAPAMTPTATLMPTATAAPTMAAPTATPTAPAPTMAAPTPEKVRVDARGVEQVWVRPGSFLMGTSDAEAKQAVVGAPTWAYSELSSEQPQHPVQLTAGYWMDRYEVTNAMFKQFVDAGGYQQEEHWSKEGWAWLKGRKLVTCAGAQAQERPDYPCVGVTWYEAEAYAHWRGGRLPTEAEWEYAARGPQSLVYPWGNTFDASLTNVVSSTGLTPVGSYPGGASWVGAQDMAGNAMEWVQDWLDVNYYELAVGENPTGPETGVVKIEKGGWWGSYPFVARAAYRHFEDAPDYKDRHIGFRVVTP